MNFLGHALFGKQNREISTFLVQKGTVSLAWSLPEFD